MLDTQSRQQAKKKEGMLAGCVGCLALVVILIACTGLATMMPGWDKAQQQMKANEEERRRKQAADSEKGNKATEALNNALNANIIKVQHYISIAPGRIFTNSGIKGFELTLTCSDAKWQNREFKTREIDFAAAKVLWATLLADTPGLDQEYAKGKGILRIVNEFGNQLEHAVVN